MGLYYYGARYLDPKYSRWLSTDPALGEYIPIAATNDEAKRHNSNLPGMGGVFNHINFNLYHYAGNNPVKYVDPDGRYAGVSLNLVPPGNPNGTASEQRDYDLNQKFADVSTYWGQMTVAIHGSEYGVFINHKRLNIEKLAEMIKNDPRYEEAKSEARQKGRKMEIILLSCETGKNPANGDLPVGQKLANALADEDVVVKAPDKEVIPCRLDSLSPGYELSSTGVVRSGQAQEPRVFKKFEYKKTLQED